MAKAAWNRTIVDAAGNVLPGADITVTDERTGTLATLFDDRDGNDAKSNPFVADTNGFARFFADAGVYRVVAESGALSRTWRFQSLLDNGVPITWTEDQVFTGNATVEGDFDIEGNATVEGSLDIDGALTLSSGIEFPTLNPASELFAKSDPEKPAWKKTAVFAVSTDQAFTISVGNRVFNIADSTVVEMPGSATIGQDYAIWIRPDGTLVATTDHSNPPVSGSRQIGGFHYAPNDNATLAADGDWTTHSGAPSPAVPQINEYSFYDLKWRPSAPDPRGLALVPGLNEWWGIYPMNNGNVAGKPIHSYGVEPCRDGNPPFKRWADTPAAYPDAKPMNIFELLASEGFRPPNVWNFQYAALGTTEQAAAGTTPNEPGNTGEEQGTGRNRNRFVSAWGLFDITGVIRAWAMDSLPDNTQTAGVTQGRSDDIFRISRFAHFGGNWNSAALAGSRFVNATSSSGSDTRFGGRGVCDHLVLV